MLKKLIKHSDYTIYSFIFTNPTNSIQITNKSKQKNIPYKNQNIERLKYPKPTMIS